jgi:hypothetical protein
MMNKALKSFKDAGDYNAPIWEWAARPVVMQTWENLKTMMCMEYAKIHCQNAITAQATGDASANVMEEYANATEELIKNLTEKHTTQIEALLKSNSDAMTKLLESFKHNAPAPETAPAATAASDPKKAAKHKAWVERCKTATKCPHCNKVHPNWTHAQCWELNANAAKCPVGWKSLKVA